MGSSLVFYTNRVFWEHLNKPPPSIAGLPWNWRFCCCLFIGWIYTSPCWFWGKGGDNQHTAFGFVCIIMRLLLQFQCQAAALFPDPAFSPVLWTWNPSQAKLLCVRPPLHSPWYLYRPSSYCSTAARKWALHPPSKAHFQWRPYFSLLLLFMTGEQANHATVCSGFWLFPLHLTQLSYPWRWEPGCDSFLFLFT